MQKQAQLAIPMSETITGFNYAFCEALLAKLLTLQKENRLYTEAYEEGWGCLSGISACALNHLIEQLKLSSEGFLGEGKTQYKDVNAVMHTAEEFLAIFEKKA